MAVLGLAVLTAIAEAGQDDRSQVDAEKSGEVILMRKSIIGVSQHVKGLLKENPQGRHFQKDLTHLLIEERPVPASCGVRIAKFFRSEMVSLLSVPARDSCLISDKTVECPTEYLPGYSKVYLLLTYKWRPDQLDLTLTVKHQGIWGVQENRLLQEHVAWFEGLFDCLLSIAECNDQLPFCARRSSQPK